MFMQTHKGHQNQLSEMARNLNLI